MSDMQRRIRSFVMRAGRMTEGQQKGWDAGFPQFGLTQDAGRLDWDAAFPNPGRRVVEIGFGMGDSLLEMAAADANSNFVGIEVHRPGVGRLLSGVLDRELNNLRVYAEDAVEIFERCIDDASLDAIQIYFPDPWHKKRHNKRRLIQPPFVALLTRKLKAGGVLHLATDWENYAEQMLEVLEAAEGLRNVAGSGQYSPRPAYRPETKFERRGARLGHGVWDLLYQRAG
ncbi:MAG: tRNA (guanosine(46)-N7)-methyltransferase TrmB [Halieaceae bacterium]|jgi:tRNA (guanine-N7-)-methyltransferase|nr:tRNA (guanosine(46)-N7)-methyltransferase TrmB [Halieaceae bacterium]